MGKMNKGLIKAIYVIEVKDEKGKVIERRTGNVNSFNKNFVLWFYQKFTACFLGAEAYGDNTKLGRTVEMKSIYAETFNIPYNKTGWNGVFGAFGGRAGDNLSGIMVGSGDTPFTPTDYALASKIHHGSGSGQLIHDRTYFTAPEVLTDKIQFTFYRSFTNNSGATITVKEIGIYYVTLDSFEYTRYICIERSVLSSPVAVPNGKVLTVRYIFWTTF